MTTLITRTVVLQTLRYAKPVQLSAAVNIFTSNNTFEAYRLQQPNKTTSRLILTPHSISQYVRYVSDKSDRQTLENKPEEAPQKLTIFQRFKQMYRDYWYVLVPVHLITSAGWFGSFYYMAKSGIDVVAIMESMKISAKIISPLKDSSLGYFAISYAMYKIATPVRYTVTLGGTTVAISYLQKFGYIKPVPSKKQLKELYMEKKENIMDSMKDKREELRLKRDALKDKTDNLIDDMERKIVTKINDTKKKTTSTIEKP